MNEQLGELIRLDGSASLVTEREDDIYHVASGRVRVFVARFGPDGRRDRLVPLGTLPEGANIPSFALRDTDEEGRPRSWGFILESPEGAGLLWNRGLSSSVARRRFIERLPSYGKELVPAAEELKKYYENEGRSFERALVEFYEGEYVRDMGFISSGERSGENERQDAFHIISGVLGDGVQVSGESAVYRALAYVCGRCGIAIDDYAVVRAACGDEVSVSSIARVSNFACRSVILEPGWHRTDIGPLVADMGGVPVGCVPKGTGRYTLYDSRTGETVPLTDELAAKISPQGTALCRALPARALTKKDLVAFGARSLSRADIILTAVLAAVGALLGVLMPMLNQKIYDDYIPLGDESQLVQICVVIASFMISGLFFDMVRRLSEYRISSHVGLDMQNAVYHRVFQLPESFFRRFDSADLGQRLMYAPLFCDAWVNLFVISSVSLVCSSVYLYKMFGCSARMSGLALALMAVYAVAVWLLRARKLGIARRAEELKGRASAKLYQYLGGVEKLRMAGAEDKAANEYLRSFSAQQNTELRLDKLSALDATLSCGVSALFSILFYYLAAKGRSGLSVGSFMAFNSAFGAFSGTVFGTLSGALDLYELRAMYERFRPVVETAPEDDGRGGVVSSLSGEIELRDLRFSYDRTNSVINGISHSFKKGGYTGIVGASGCGKSTLIKLLLGFERPSSGQVLYDGRDINSLDKRSLRKHLGVVLQNGKLIAGSIFENITIGAPHATAADVRRVIEAVGLKDDIAQMPMGIHTVLSEDSGTISGGQRQRILIARAIISDPAVLIFDEATSALDNLTQAEVCRSLEKMNVTRIAVAHRLSTIKNCDEIIVIDKGRIVESGSYDELMARGGLFCELARRQIS